MPQRDLTLTTLDEAIEEAKRLHAGGYEKLGEWDLSQACDHLAMPVRGAMEGMNVKVSVFLRLFIRLFAKKSFFRTRKIKPGIKAPAPVPPSRDDAEAIRDFEQAIRDLQAYDGPLHDHPFFGKFTREEWIEFNVIHAQHHLSFLKPKAEAPTN